MKGVLVGVRPYGLPFFAHVVPYVVAGKAKLAQDQFALESHQKAVAAMADDMETLADVTAEGMVDELAAHAKEFLVAGTAQGLAQIPVLAITANDHLAPQTDALVAAIKATGGKVTAMHMETDHSYSDHRIALEGAVITWLSRLN